MIEAFLGQAAHLTIVWCLTMVVVRALALHTRRIYKAQRVLTLPDATYPAWEGWAVELCVISFFATLVWALLAACHAYWPQANRVAFGLLFIPLLGDIVSYFLNFGEFSILADKGPDNRLVYSVEDMDFVGSRYFMGFALMLFGLFALTSDQTLLGGGLGSVLLSWCYTVEREDKAEAELTSFDDKEHIS